MQNVITQLAAANDITVTKFLDTTVTKFLDQAANDITVTPRTPTCTQPC